MAQSRAKKSFSLAQEHPYESENLKTPLLLELLSFCDYILYREAPDGGLHRKFYLDFRNFELESVIFICG